jgi:hypothetical protein
MTLRILPAICAETGDGFDRTRLTTDDYDFSDFMRSLPSVKYVGIDQKFTFLTYDPRRVYSGTYNPRTDNPYHVLYNAVMTATKQSGEAIVNGKDVLTGKWLPLVSEGTQKAFNAPSKTCFLQGAIYESDGELFIKDNEAPKGLRDNDIPQIIQISKSAGDKLARKLNMLNPEYRGDTSPEFQEQMYLYGDLVDIATGRFVTLFNPKQHHDVCDDFDADIDNGDSDGDGDGGFTSWGVAINKEFTYVAKKQTYSVSGDLSQHADRIGSSVVSWDDVLYFPPDEEICLWLAQAFQSMPDLLRFGWLDNPEFFTDEVEGVLANRTVISTSTPSEPATAVRPGKPTQASAPAQRSATIPAATKRVEAVAPPVEVQDEDYEEDLRPEYDVKQLQRVEFAPPAMSASVPDLSDYEDDLEAEVVDSGTATVEEPDYDAEDLAAQEAEQAAAEKAALAAMQRASMRAKSSMTQTGNEKPKATTRPVPTRIKR